MRMKPWVLWSLFPIAGLACSSAAAPGGAGAGGAGEALASGAITTDASTTAQAQTASVASSSSTGGPPAPLELLHLEGRFDESNADKPRFSWPGTSIGARFTGGCQKVEVSLEGVDGVWFQVEVDGQPTSKFITTGGAATYTVATDLPDDGHHDIRIVRRNEGWLGKVSFVSFEATGCEMLESPVPHAHRIEFIGDSNTCGYGDEGTAPCSFSADTENVYLTYAAIAARNLDASAHFIAYSGKGVYQNSGGDTDHVMPELYLRTLWDDDDPSYDFSRFDPEVVLVNLGSNDFAHPIADETFIGAYEDFLGEIRERRPNATIICVIWTKWGEAHGALVTEAVDRFGDPNVSTTLFERKNTEPNGCDAHPSLVTHARIGEQLTELIQTKLGW